MCYTITRHLRLGSWRFIDKHRFNRKVLTYHDVLESIDARYAQFSGRARRREFWLFQLVHYIIDAVLSAVDFMVFFDRQDF